MHAFTYQIYELKIKFKKNLKFKIIIYTYHILKKNQILNFFSKHVCQFYAYEIHGCNTIVGISCQGMHVCFNFF